MIRRAAIGLTICATLAACGGSGGSFNPFNWFRPAQADQETLAYNPEADRVEAEYRGLVDQILSLQIDQTPGGAIIRAVGLPPTQGWHGAELVARNEELPVDGVLTYDFRIEEPYGFERIVNQTSREVVVAHHISDVALTGVTAIRIVGVQNALISRR